MTSNGIFGTKEEVIKELNHNLHSEINFKTVNLDTVSMLYKNSKITSINLFRLECIF